MAENSEQLESLAPQRILVIDDEPVIGMGIRRVFTKDGHTVDTFDDSQAGLQAALDGEYDIIFVDWMMPGVSGIWWMTPTKTPEQVEWLRDFPAVANLHDQSVADAPAPGVCVAARVHRARSPATPGKTDPGPASATTGRQGYRCR